MEHSIFISCCSQDFRPEVWCEKLEALGASCWMAPRDIPEGEIYARAIMNGVNNAQVVLVFVTKEALVSNEILSELDAAYQGKKPIVPIYLEEIPLSFEFGYYLKRQQGIHAAEDPNKGFAELVDYLKTIPGVLEQSLETPTSEPSIEPSSEPIQNPSQEKPKSHKGLVAILCIATAIHFILLVITSCYLVYKVIETSFFSSYDYSLEEYVDPIYPDEDDEVEYEEPVEYEEIEEYVEEVMADSVATYYLYE